MRHRWETAEAAWRAGGAASRGCSRARGAAAAGGGRGEVELLRAALNELVVAIAHQHGVAAPGASVAQLLAAAPAGDVAFRQLHATYDAGVRELARQASAHTLERGQLLLHVWHAHVELVELALAAKDAELARLELRAQRAERARDAAAEGAAQLLAAERALAARSAELGAMTASRDTLVALTRSLQTALKRADARADADREAAAEADALLLAWPPH